MPVEPVQAASVVHWARMSGFVLDSNGKGVERARILTTGDELLATTALHGAFEIRCDPDLIGNEVYVRASGFAPRGFSISESTESDPVYVQLARAGVLEIALVAGDGSDVEPCEIQVTVDADYCREGRSIPPRMRLTEIEWRKAFDGTKPVVFEGLPPHTPLSIDVMRRGKLLARSAVGRHESLSPEEWRQWSIVIREYNVYGRLADGEGRGIPQEVIYLVDRDDGDCVVCDASRWRVLNVERDSTLPSTVTDYDGVFRFDSVGTDACWVGIAHFPGDQSRMVASCLKSTESPSRPTDVALPEWMELCGRVIDETGMAVQDATVMLDCPSFCDIVATITTDLEGRFCSPFPRDLRAEVLVCKDTFVASSTSWLQQDWPAVVIKLDRGGELVGVVSGVDPHAPPDGTVEVFFAGKSVAGAAVTLGHFEVDELRSGTYSVVVECADGGFARASDIRLDADRSPRSTVYLRPEPPAFLAVRSDEDGPPIEYTVEWNGDVVRRGFLVCGQESVIRVPAAALTVTVKGDGAADSWTRRVTLLPGGHAAVSLRQ